MKQQQGLGLVEVMVAALITAIGILGYAGMQVQTLGAATNAQNRMQALALAGDLVSRIRVNSNLARSNYIGANYSPAAYSAAIPPCFTADCAPVALANADINALRQHLGSLLPSADLFVVSLDAASTLLIVRVAWSGQAPTAENCENSAPVLNQGNQFETRCVALEVSI